MSASDRPNIDQLFREYARGVGSYVYARTGNSDVAEQITSAVFLTVVQKMDQCRSSPQGWLWSIVRSELARYFRDHRATEPVPATLSDPNPSPPESAQREEARLSMQRALAHLDDRQQRIVYLKFFQDMSNVDIGIELGISASNVGVIVHRAVAHLRELMEAFSEPARVTKPSETKQT